jgi:serine/threonine-protein kinase
MTQPDSRLSAYDVVEEIGRGDLTIMYRALRKSDSAPVVVNVIAPQFVSDTFLVRRYLEAGERAARLDHPNIARVYETGQRGDVAYVVREWIEDESLAPRLARRGPLAARQAVPVVRQLAAALDYAHSQRVMHGDLNDRCVFLGDDDHVTVADFGLVQAMEDTESLAGVRKTKTPQSVGAPEYMSSERAQGQGPNRAADIYALGVLTYQMLAGRVPFRGEPDEVLQAQVRQAPPPLHTANPDVSLAVSDVVGRALAKRPEMRFNTATEFARALASAAEGTAPVRVAAEGVRRPPLKIWQRPIFWAIVVAPIIGLFLAVMLWNLAGWGERQVTRLGASPTPRPTLQPDYVTETPAPAAAATPGPAQTEPGALPLSPPPGPGPGPIQTPAPLTIQENSPFTNLLLARGISDDHQPVAPGSSFTPGRDPIYLFFDYRGIQPGTQWGHVWFWGDQQLDRSITTWPETWSTAGRAWVFYTPEGGYQPGPHEVRLLVNDQVVASASFVIQ